MARVLTTILLIVVIALLSTLLTIAYQGPKEVISPHNRISQEQIKIYPEKVVLDIKGTTWATYADTNSMDPILDSGAIGIEIIPETEEELHNGDIIAYESTITKEIIVHRIVDIKEDSQGKYFITKGDNNKSIDPEKIRFNQVKAVLIGILY